MKAMYGCIADKDNPNPAQLSFAKKLCDHSQKCTLQSCDNFWGHHQHCDSGKEMWVKYRCQGNIKKKRKYHRTKNIKHCNVGISSVTPSQSSTSSLSSLPSSPPSLSSLSSLPTPGGTGTRSKCSAEQGTPTRVYQRDVHYGDQINIDCEGGCIEIVKVINKYTRKLFY